MPVLSTLLHATAFKTPLLRTLVPTIGLAYGIQLAAAVPSIFARTERFYDASGSLTYLSCAAVSLLLPHLRARALNPSLGVFPPLAALNWRQLALTGAVSIWATRLGSFLYDRITKDDGKDSRFDSIRDSPLKFGGAFFAQATWVSLCLLPVICVNAIPAGALGALGAFTITDIIGVLLYVGGLSFEVTADRQKSAWMKEKKEKKHNEQFLTRGLWSKSRHPNYFGESTLWTGIATLAGGVMMSGVGQAGMGLSGGLGGVMGAGAMAYVSPAFVTFLLLKVSGVPMSEKKYDKRFKGNKEYEQWKKDTPMFVPKL